jgi:membrane protein YdbS with pleckstrin-like domain
MIKIYCSNCGQMIPESSKFCRFCGAAQHGQQSAVFQASAPTIALDSINSVQQEKQQQQQQQQYANTNPPTDENHNRQDTDSTQAIEPNVYIPRKKLCKSVVWSFYISYLQISGIILLILMFGIIYYPIIIVGAIIIYLIILWIIAQIVYDHFYFSVDENGFQKEHGVIHKYQVSIPYQQIQNVNITRSLTDRVLGLARINIETAGSSKDEKRDVVGGSKTMAEGHLPGLTMKEAIKVHDLLLHKANQFGRHNSN